MFLAGGFDGITVGKVPDPLKPSLVALAKEINEQIGTRGYNGCQSPIDGDKRRVMVNTSEIASGRLCYELFLNGL